MFEIAIAFAVGTVFGTGMTCCFVVAGRADREIEYDRDKNIEEKSDIS
ncbi:MAG: hypothetical protein ACLRQ0_13625 [Monoglobales bacterium]